MLKIRKQIECLYISTILDNLSLTGAWVAILAARGFDLVEISLAETVFHIVSLIFELPSGILADVFGRKRMLLVSVVMRSLANLMMIFSHDLATVCLSIGLTALGYNFASGTGDALAYDSLKCAGQEGCFDRFESNLLTIYRLCSGLSTLCAGLALSLGYRIAYGIDLISAAVQILVLFRLQEVRFQTFQQDAPVWERLLHCAEKSVSFLKAGPRVLLLMFGNSLVGAIDILLLFFIQAKLPGKGIPQWALGVALLFMELGGIAGSRIVLKASRWRYRTVFLAAVVLVLFGMAVEHSALYRIMVLGGFLAAAADDALQVRTNALLQSLFPSQQRATLTSVESFSFSAIMVVLTPLAGVFYTHW